ncbi:unnamed protein product [Musa textilis]
MPADGNVKPSEAKSHSHAFQVCSYAFVAFFLFIFLDYIFMCIKCCCLMRSFISIVKGKYASNMLSWFLASEANSAANGDPLAAPCTRGVKSYKVNSEVFHLLVAEDPVASLPLSAPLRATSGNVTFDMIPNKSALMGSLESPKPISAIKSFNSPGRREICRPPGRSKSMLSAFFNKNKTFKTRKVSVS